MPRADTYRGDILHEPWPLQPARAWFRSNTMTQPLDLELSGAPLLHFSKRLDVKIWALARC